MIRIERERCIGCGACVDACFSGAIKTDDSDCAAVNDSCIYCGNCINVCPVQAISMDEGEKSQEKPDLESYVNVWVMVENDRETKSPKKVSFELLSEGRKLADKLGEELYAVYLCGKLSEQTLKDLEKIGCDHLILVEREELEQYSTEWFSGITTELIRKYKPSIVLFPGTENGRDLAPRISARLRVGLTADCTALEINEKRELVQVRPTYGGNIIASIVTPKHRPQMASVRANIFNIEYRKQLGKLDIIRPEIAFALKETRVKCIGTEPRTTAYKDVEEAKVLIVGGYGAGREGFRLIHELALKMDAAVGATRKAVDEGWAPFEIQIGQTGKIVAPDVYLCFGVSGALQHTIGIRGAKKIIAVNRDPAAQIFGISDVAILGDCEEVLKHLIQQADAKGKKAFSIIKQ